MQHHPDWDRDGQCLLPPTLLTLLQPGSTSSPRLLERLKDMLPDTLFFKTAKGPFDDSVLLRRIRRDTFLLQPIVPTSLPKAPALKNQAIVAAEDQRAPWTQGSKSLQTRRFNGSFCLLGSAPYRKLIPHHFPIMTVDQRGQMRPATLPTGNMRHIPGPAFVAPAGPAHPPQQKLLAPFLHLGHGQAVLPGPLRH